MDQSQTYSANAHVREAVLHPRRFWARLLRWQELARQRAQLAELDDHLLRDMGLTRADARLEATRPFWDESAT